MGSSAVYESNGVMQADWIDDGGNVVHQWWGDRGWVVELVAGPDADTEVKLPAMVEYGVTWMLAGFDQANRIDLWAVSGDGTHAIHAWASPGERWHSEQFASPARRDGI